MQANMCHDFRIKDGYQYGNLIITRDMNVIKIYSSSNNLELQLNIFVDQVGLQTINDLVTEEEIGIITTLYTSSEGLKLLGVFSIQGKEVKIYVGRDMTICIYIEGIPLYKLLPSRLQITSGVYIDDKGFIRIPQHSVLSKEEMLESIDLMKKISFFSDRLLPNYTDEKVEIVYWNYYKINRAKLSDTQLEDQIMLSKYYSINSSSIDYEYGPFLLSELEEATWQMSLNSSTLLKLGFTYLAVDEETNRMRIQELETIKRNFINKRRKNNGYLDGVSV